ncbi:hypothetical protein [Shinella oryzae]|uniref:Uncharacterized protein n=1 Tax=Shinella oryzae TaxID=2871820 RepID=A0ABY9JZI6_9HYPH|nr:hypothetical protein [Shinella oryzae]WLS01706.1 hypothetical protein Q9315_09620 [Shinella oryzae]
MRCDLHTKLECSCIASGVSCRVQAPLDLGTYRGTNNPGPLDGYPTTARDITYAFIGLVALVGITLLIIYRFAALVGPVNV